MGSLQPVTVVRYQDGMTLTGHAWSLEDGTFECFWSEDGSRMSYYFDSIGQQIKVRRKSYEIRFAEQ